MTKKQWDDMTHPQLWLVGRYLGPEQPGPEVTAFPWEFFGVFGTRELARAACTKDIDFYVPVRLNVRAPEALEYFTGAVYPLRELKP